MVPWSIDFKTIAEALRRYGKIQAFKNGKSLHSQLIKSGFLSNIFIDNNLISMYADWELLSDAHQVFEEMPERNVVSWTTLISAYTYAGNPAEALRIFKLMLKLELEMPNSFTLSAALKACAKIRNLELGKLIHERISRTQLQYNTVLMNTLVDMYVKCGSLCNARTVFNEIFWANSTTWNTIIAGYSNEGRMEEATNLLVRMPEPDIVSWNTVIAGFANKEDAKALQFLYMMHREGVKLDQFTFPCALKICGCMRLLMMGKQIHCYVIKSGFGADCFTGSALVDMYAKCGEVDEAAKIFYEHLSYGGSVLDKLALWNSMVSGYAINEQNVAALDLVSQLHKSGLALDPYTFSSVLKVCINLLDSRFGHQTHGLIVVSGYHLDSIVGSILIDFYAKCSNMEAALRLFHMLPHKDMIAWAGLIARCVQQGSNKLAFSLFKEMVCSSLEADQFVVSSVLKACSSVAVLDCGKQVHAYSVKTGYESEGVTVTSLIDMYSKCGEIEDGLILFKGITKRDTVSWTGIIAGCGQNGRSKEAIEFFKEMLESGVAPNEITYLGVLSACRHAGLVAQARILFKSMGVEHGLVPYLEHYCCMVDLLGRAGCFEEAECLIANMPYEPDETIWGSLLGACGIHKNVELGKRVVERLIAISRDDAPVYVTLSNVYASLGLWDDSSKLREVMREMGLKEAGRSWIEVRS